MTFATARTVATKIVLKTKYFFKDNLSLNNLFLLLLLLVNKFIEDFFADKNNFL